MRYFLAICCLALVACQKNSPNYTSLYQDDGHRKPQVALVQVIDHSDAELPWSLSEEFTETLTQRIQNHSKLHLANHYDVAQIIHQCDDSSSPFSTDISWMHQSFKDQQFVVFVELVDHYLHTHPHQRIAELEENRSAFFDLTMRIRIVDVRGDRPKVVLQELVHHNHSIPKLFANIDYEDKHWGTTSFNFTPMGLAHGQLVREVCTRIEDYISIAQSK